MTEQKKCIENHGKNYNVYHFSWCDEVKCFACGMGLAGFAAWLLYRNICGIVLAIVIVPFYRKNYRNLKIAEQKRELLLQFKEAMQSVSIAILSGYSMENAWIEAEREMRELYGQDAVMTSELKQMNGAIRMNQPVEQELYQFALRSGCEDIKSFAEVFVFAKRSGGNFGKIIQNTTKRIAEKMEVEREIATVIAGKKMEQKVMNIVPVCLLCYLNVTSEEFLEPLYGNYAGACVMTLAFVVYMAAFAWAKKMVQINI